VFLGPRKPTLRLRLSTIFHFVRIGIRQRTSNTHTLHRSLSGSEYDVKVSDRLGEQIHWQNVHSCPCVVQQYRYLIV
jgi:hypothetical protein